MTNELLSQCEDLLKELAEAKSQLVSLEAKCVLKGQRESELLKQIQVLEINLDYLRPKAEAVVLLKNRVNLMIEKCNGIQQARKNMEEKYRLLVEFCKKQNAELESFKKKADMVTEVKDQLVKKLKVNKKQTLSFLKTIDELASLSCNLPYHLRRRVDQFAGRDFRKELFGPESYVSNDTNDDNDDAMASEIEALINSGVCTPLSERRYAPRRFSNKTGLKPKRIKMHSIIEAEDAYSEKLTNKLAINENHYQPMSEIAGGHSTIHGRKGPSVREIQAEMMTISVKEKVAELKRKKEANCSAFDDCHYGLFLSPSPERRDNNDFFEENDSNLIIDTDDADSFCADHSDNMPDFNYNHNNNLMPISDRVAEVALKNLPKAIESGQDLTRRLSIFRKCYQITDISVTKEPKRDPKKENVEEVVNLCHYVMSYMTTFLPFNTMNDSAKILVLTVRVSLIEAHILAQYLAKFQSNCPEQRRGLYSVLNDYIKTCQCLSNYSVVLENDL